MKHLLLFLALLFALPAFAGTRSIVNPDNNGDVKITVNKGGTATDALVVSGATGKVRVQQGFDSTGGAGLATSTASGLVSAEDSGSFTASFTGAASVSVTFNYAHVGNAVTLRWSNITVAASSSAGLDAASATIPAWLRPATNLTLNPSYYSVSGSGVGAYTLFVNSNGSLTLRKEAGGLFSSGTTYTLNASSVMYPVN